MNKLFKNIIAPESYLSASNGLIVGFLVTCILGLLGYYSKTVLDGALDLHQVDKISLYESISLNFINWVSISLSFYIVAKVFQSKIRFIDLSGIMGAIKVWYVFPLILGLYLHPKVDINEMIKGHIEPSIVFIGLASAVFSIIFIIYAFKAFRVNSHLKDGKLIIGFIAGLFIAEIISKFFIYFIF